jgi:hypothetical protein
MLNTLFRFIPRRVLTLSVILLISSSIFFSLWTLLFFQLKSLLPETLMKQQIDRLIRDSKLEIAYESINYSFLDGLVIQRLRVSSNQDFSLGRVFFEAPEISVPIQLSVFLGEPLRVRLNRGRWSFYLANEEEQLLLNNQLENWFSKSLNFKFVMIDNSVVLHSRNTNYDKQQIDIEKVNGSFENLKKGKFLVKLRYESQKLGEGVVNFHQKCTTLCPLTEGEVSWEGSSLPLKMLDWWVEEKFQLEGTASGTFSMNLLPSESRQQFRAELTLDKLKLFKEEALVLQGFLDYAEISADYTKDKLKLNSKGLWSDHNFELTYEKDNKAPLPSYIKLNVNNPENKDSALLFSSENSLTGLEHFSLEYALNKKNIVTGSAKIIVNNGVLQVSKQEKIQLSKFQLDWNENFLKVQMQAKRLDTKAEFGLQGPLRLATRLHIKAAFPLIRGFQRSKKEHILTGRGRLDGTLEVEQFNPAQWLGPFKGMQESWHARIKAEEDFRWMPSRVRDRIWFQRFIEGMQYNVRLKFLEIFFSENKFLTIDGFLSVDGYKSALELEEREKTQRASIRSLHGGNVPYFIFNFDYLLQGDFPFLNLWHPLSLFASFQECSGSIRIKTNGELPVHMQYNRQVNEYGRCSSVELERSLQEQGLIPRWTEVSFSSTGRSDSGRLINLRGFKDRYFFNAGGGYSVKNFKPNYEVKVYSSQLP